MFAVVSHESEGPDCGIRLWVVCLLACIASGCAQQRPIESIPAAARTGWETQTRGGADGQMVRVTTLAASGPGSLQAALQTSGPRVIVFEVGGVIDLNRESLVIDQPFVTVAGQTAPSPGITLIRGGIRIHTHDVIIRHLRVRPGEAGAAKRSGWEIDAIATGEGAHDVVVDHCSLSWGTDETLSASGPRFRGSTPEEWRRNTSHRITFSNNIVAETLGNSTHSKGHHSRGMLIHDNVTNVLIRGNLFAHNTARNPQFKAGASGSIVNNIIYNPGNQAVTYSHMVDQWRGRRLVAGELDVVGNVMQLGPDSTWDGALVMHKGGGRLTAHIDDNVVRDLTGRPATGLVRATAEAKQITLAAQPLRSLTVRPLPSSSVEQIVLREVGARPWDRDSTDARIIATVTLRSGSIIDSEQDVGGYPVQQETRRPFDESCWSDVLGTGVAETKDPDLCAEPAAAAP